MFRIETYISHENKQTILNTELSENSTFYFLEKKICIIGKKISDLRTYYERFKEKQYLLLFI